MTNSLTADPIDRWTSTGGPSVDALRSITNVTGRNGTIFVVDDDANLRDALTDLLETEGWVTEAYAGAEQFLAAWRGDRVGCLVVDLCLPGMGGIALLEHLAAGHSLLPVVVISGHANIPIAVRAMEAGAVSFIQKPVSADQLLEVVDRAVEKGRERARASLARQAAAGRISVLTPRERQVMDLVMAGHANNMAGHANKEIAYRLGISQRTIENHRASVMTKTGATSLPDLARLDFVAQRMDPGTTCDRPRALSEMLAV